MKFRLTRHQKSLQLSALAARPPSSSCVSLSDHFKSLVCSQFAVKSRCKRFVKYEIFRPSREVVGLLLPFVPPLRPFASRTKQTLYSALVSRSFRHILIFRHCHVLSRLSCDLWPLVPASRRMLVTSANFAKAGVMRSFAIGSACLSFIQSVSRITAKQEIKVI